jgi:site-specific recombinase XerD
VSALLAYLGIRGNEPGPLFRLNDGRYLTKEIFIAKVRAALSVLGLDSSTYAGHSFRIGAATTAAEIGIEDSVIKMLGRWDSSAYQLYVRASRQVLASVSRRLASPRDE